MELTEHYEGLVTELDATLHAHQGLTALQKQLSEELRVSGHPYYQKNLYLLWLRMHKT